MVGATAEPTLAGSFEAHINGNELACMPFANLVQALGNIGKCCAFGNAKRH